MVNSDCSSALAPLCCCLVCVATLLAIGVHSTVLFDKYSPVYTDVVCGEEEVSLGRIEVSIRKITVNLYVEVTCTNPNPYDVHVKEPKKGRILMARDMQQVGTIALREGRIPEGGGKIGLDGLISLSGISALGLIGRFLRGPQSIFMEIDFTAVIEESLIFTSIELNADYSDKCGISVNIRGESLHDMVCGASFSDLQVSSEGVKLRPGAPVGVSEEAIKDATKQKNLILGLLISLSFSLIFILLVVSFVFLWRQFRTARRKAEHGAATVSPNEDVFAVGKPGM